MPQGATSAAEATTFNISLFKQEKGVKESGVTRGFTKEIDLGPYKGTYMFKRIPRSIREQQDTTETPEGVSTATSSDENCSVTTQDVNRGNAVVEFVFSGIFKQVLGEQAPIIRLVIDEQNKLFLTSKFLNDFSHIDQFTKEHPDLTKDIQGLEKVVITSLYRGDSDLNTGNVGITMSAGACKAAKINHGSAGIIDKDQDFAQGIKLHYLKRIYASELNFNLQAAREATQEILAHTDSHQEISQDAINQLKDHGVKPEYTSTLTFETQELDFTDYLATRRQKLKEFDEKLSIIDRIEHPDPNWKTTTKWLEAADNPLKFAEEKGFNLRPIEFSAIEATQAQAEQTVSLEAPTVLPSPPSVGSQEIGKAPVIYSPQPLSQT